MKKKNPKNQNVVKLKLRQNSRTQFMTKLKKSKCDKTKKIKLLQNLKVKLWQNLKKYNFNLLRRINLKWSLSKNILTPWQPIWWSLGSVLRFLQHYLIVYKKLHFSSLETEEKKLRQRLAVLDVVGYRNGLSHFVHFP